MDFEYKEEYQKLSSACLNITDACNLKCVYCFVEQHPHFMDLNTAKASVDFLVNNLRWKKQHKYLSKNAKANINFFGGEPTILWDQIIVPLTLWTEQIYPNEVHFSMTTNGTLLNEERIDFLKAHHIGVLLSMDGAEYTQNKNRPCQDENQKSFDLIYPNISKLLKYNPDLTFRATIDQNTVNHTFENYLFAYKCGFKHIFMIPNGRETWSEENKYILKEEVKKIFLYMTNLFLQNTIPIEFGPITTIYKLILKSDIARLNHQYEKPFKPNSVKRCGLGTVYGSISYDGHIYGCQEQDSKELKNIFLIGDIYNGINKEKHNQLLKIFFTPSIFKCKNENLCNNCIIKNICHMEGCPSSNWDLFNNFNINSEISCYWKQCLMEGAIIIMKYLTQNNNQTFKNYLDVKCNYKKHTKGEK